MNLEWQIINELRELKKGYTPWFRRFIKHLEVNFSNVTSDGVMLVFSQSPASAFTNLNDEQFKQYVLAVFTEFIEEIKSF